MILFKQDSAEISRNIYLKLKNIDGIILPILQLLSKIVVCTAIFILTILNYKIIFQLLFYFLFFIFSSLRIFRKN